VQQQLTQKGISPVPMVKISGQFSSSRVLPGLNLAPTLLTWMIGNSLNRAMASDFSVA
jgi:hypothetical protein